MSHQEFEVPEEVVIDPVLGLALNVPAVHQAYPFWWEVQPETYTALQNARERAGIVIEDFPDGKPVRVNDTKPLSMSDYLAARKGAGK